MEKKSPKISHIELNVSEYARSIRFYDKVLCPIGWERLVCTNDFTAYSDGFSKIILSPVSSEFKSSGFHRKRIGLNHIALYMDSKPAVDKYYRDVMLSNGIPSLYQEGPEGDNQYYSVLFEDPDRMKIEVVYAPQYCDKKSWPNNIESDFDPYGENESMVDE